MIRKMTTRAMKEEKPPYIHINHWDCMNSTPEPSGLLQPIAPQPESKGIRNIYPQLYIYISPIRQWIPETWTVWVLTAAPFFLKIYFQFPLQCFSWRRYSLEFLMTDRSTNFTQFEEITIFKLKTWSTVFQTQSCTWPLQKLSSTLSTYYKSIFTIRKNIHF